MRSSTLFVLGAAVHSALATIFVTAPVASTTYEGGASALISWEDDGTAPSLSLIGACSVGIYAGNTQQQTLLQEIISSVNVATTASISFTVDPTIGPDGSAYFIRFQSLAYMNPTTPQYPYEQFSARFTLADMTGTFNASVQAEIGGAASATTGGLLPTPSAAATHASASNENSVATVTKAATAGAASASTTAKASGAASLSAGILQALAVGASVCLVVLAL